MRGTRVLAALAAQAELIGRLLRCAWYGHAWSLEFDPLLRRLYLRCGVCWRETPGWNL